MLMNDLIKKVREHYKTLTPLSSTLIKFYIPILAVLTAAATISGLSYLFTSSDILYNLVLDCAQALKSTAGLALFSFIIARAVK